MKATRLFLLLVVISLAACSQQGKPVESDKSVTIKSVVLNETRELLIYSPPQAHGKSKKYPVIYLFDGESLFDSMVGAERFLNRSIHMPQMPEAYIIGIVNTDRDRDMPVPQSISSTNGAANFYKFLTEEVMPFVNNNYSTSGLNILAGHSQGGLFVTYAGLRDPKLFPFVMALDAPMTVVKPVEEHYVAKMNNVCGLKYFSAETLYGWGGPIKERTGCLNFKTIAIKGETHESMPYKGIYEGLKFLFDDYLPKTEDLDLSGLRKYYNGLNTIYHFAYPIPEAVLVESARQNIVQSRKGVAIELLNECEKIYGQSAQTGRLMAKANSITKEPDNRATYSLTHAAPDEKEISRFLGKWDGTLVVPGGTDMHLTWEIKKIGGIYKMETRVMDQFTTISDFLYVNERGQLVWGRKHGGGGIYQSVGTVTQDGLEISGTEDEVGFNPPPGAPAAVANTFIFHKLK